LKVSELKRKYFGEEVIYFIKWKKDNEKYLFLFFLLLFRQKEVLPYIFLKGYKVLKI